MDRVSVNISETLSYYRTIVGASDATLKETDVVEGWCVEYRFVVKLY